MKEVKEKSRAQQAVRLLMLTDRLHRAAIESQIDRLGIHRSQHFLLMNLSHTDGGLPQSEIAKKLDISPAAATVTLQKLEKAGFIERKTAEGDCRSKIITLTESGRQTVRKTHELFSEVDERMCGGMTEKELDALCVILSKMADNLKAENGEEEGKE